MLDVSSGCEFFADIDKAVVEMEPEQGCWHASVVLHGSVHSALHNGESVWAGEVVEGDVQLCRAHRGDHGESQKSKA
jgi:hypothetical protein